MRDQRQISPKSLALKPHSAKARWPRKLSQRHWSWQQVAAITPRSRGGLLRWNLRRVKRTDVMGFHASPAPRDALPWDVKTGQRWNPSKLRPSARSSALPHKWLLSTTHSPRAARYRIGEGQGQGRVGPPNPNPNRNPNSNRTSNPNLQLRREQLGNVGAQPAHLVCIGGGHRGPPAPVHKHVPPAAGSARHAATEAAVTSAEVDEGELRGEEAAAAHLLDDSLVLQLVLRNAAQQRPVWKPSRERRDAAAHLERRRTMHLIYTLFERAVPEGGLRRLRAQGTAA